MCEAICIVEACVVLVVLPLMGTRVAITCARRGSGGARPYCAGPQPTTNVHTAARSASAFTHVDKLVRCVVTCNAARPPTPDAHHRRSTAALGHSLSQPPSPPHPAPPAAPPPARPSRCAPPPPSSTTLSSPSSLSRPPLPCPLPGPGTGCTLCLPASWACGPASNAGGEQEEKATGGGGPVAADTNGR